MSRLKISLAYNGSRYCGWQIQNNAITVQGELNACLQKVTGVSETAGSSRTDAGVHAKLQVLHVDVNYDDIKSLKFKLNTMLPDDVKILDIESVADEFHARFDATSRAYEYHVHRERDPFSVGMSYCSNFRVDMDLMNEAAKELLGEQNFQSFSRVKTQVNNFICTIEEAKWIETDAGMMFYIRSNRFLRGMVRAIVGTLLDVGTGKIDIERLREIVKLKDRREAGRAVPAEGLFLVEVNYPETN
jgi:tRNA pseudouridine38-40 synthase